MTFASNRTVFGRKHQNVAAVISTPVLISRLTCQQLGRPITGLLQIHRPKADSYRRSHFTIGFESPKVSNMRFSIIALVAAFSSTALAQNLLNQIPKCAQTCFGNNMGTCGLADIACICSGPNILPVSCCVFATCSQAEIASTIQFAVQICKLQNVNINTQPVCASTTATLSGSPTPSPANSTVPMVTSMAAGNATQTPGGTPHSTGSTPHSTGSTPHSTASPSHAPTSAPGSGADSLQSGGAGIGLGLAMVGLLAAL
ncbi:hypothetical protein ACEQ8H_007153 [Pleosporales sp. CAS-2024a]